jgi:hypothetical protein
MMNYSKFIAALALTGGIVLFSSADDGLNKAATDKTEVDSKNDKLPDKAASDKTECIGKKADKPLFEKKAARKIEKNSTGGTREERQAFMYIDKFSAEDRAKFKELYLQDPEKFRKELKAKILELKKQESGFQKNVSGIAEKYHKTQTAEDKQKCLAQLKETSKKEFYRNLERSKNELDSLEKRLNALRQAYENRKNNADKIIDDQVEYLTRDPSLHW